MGNSFLLPTIELLKTQRKSLKISLNKMSNDLYGNRYYVNYLAKIEKGEIPNVSFEVIAKMQVYLAEIEANQKLSSFVEHPDQQNILLLPSKKETSDIYKLAHKYNYDDFHKLYSEFIFQNVL